MRARVALAAAVTLAAAPVSAGPRAKERPLPGFAGLTYRDVEVRDGCTSTTRVVRRSKKVDDPELVTLLTWPRIKGLDFSPADPERARTSLARFQEWFQRLQKQSDVVIARQVAIARDASLPATARVEAAARLVVAVEQVADLVGGIPVPGHLRKDPALVEAYCDVLGEHGEPLARRVDELREHCRLLVDAVAAGPGWWTPVCAGPPP